MTFGLRADVVKDRREGGIVLPVHDFDEVERAPESDVGDAVDDRCPRDTESVSGLVP